MEHPKNIKSCRMKHLSSEMFDAEVFAEIFKDSSIPTGSTKEKSEQIVTNVVATSMPRCRNNAHRLLE